LSYARAAAATRSVPVPRPASAQPDAAERFMISARGPIDRSEFNPDAAHPVDRAYEELKQALRAAGQTG